LFFPVATTGEVYDAQVAAAKAVCGRCRVQAPCLTDALARIPDGVAGGLSEGERRALRADRRCSGTSDPDQPEPADPEPVPVAPARYGRAPRVEVMATAVALVGAGRAAGVVAGLVGVSERTVERWVAQTRAAAALTDPEETEPAARQEVGA